jgi:hypothetical protein
MTIIEKVKEVHQKHLEGLTEIKSVNDAIGLHDRLIKVRSELSIMHLGILEIMPHYRGQQNHEWDLTTGISRPPIMIDDPVRSRELERKAMLAFEKEVIETFGNNVLSPLNTGDTYSMEWSLLIQGQHAGIKTNLIDCTPEVLSALYFATEESKDSKIESADGKLWYILLPVDRLVGSTFGKSPAYGELDPFKLKHPVVLNPSALLDDIKNRLYEYRYYKQRGRFIALKEDQCHLPFNKESDLKDFIYGINIPSESKALIRQELLVMNITRESQYGEEEVSHQNIVQKVNSSVFGI